jgi:Zn-dependent protease
VQRGSFAENLLGAMFSLNLLLGTFNLLPVTPLDGSTGIMLFMGEKSAGRYLDWLRGNSFGILGLVAALFVFQYAYAPIENFAKVVLLWSHF